jgi:hypothetical protein
MPDDDDHYRHLRRGDTHLQGETESIAWLKAVPPVVGLDRPLQGMGKTTAKRPRHKQEEPDNAA